MNYATVDIACPNCHEVAKYPAIEEGPTIETCRACERRFIWAERFDGEIHVIPLLDLHAPPGTNFKAMWEMIHGPGDPRQRYPLN